MLRVEADFEKHEMDQFFRSRKEQQKTIAVAWMSKAQAEAAGTRSEDLAVWDECVMRQ